MCTSIYACVDVCIYVYLHITLINWSFNQLDMASTWHFLNQLIILSTVHFIKWLQYEQDFHHLSTLLQVCFVTCMFQYCDKMTRWWNDQLMIQSIYERTTLDNQVMKQPVDETTTWWRNQQNKQPVDETESWRKGQLMKRSVDETTSWWYN